MKQIIKPPDNQILEEYADVLGKFLKLIKSPFFIDYPTSACDTNDSCGLNTGILKLF